MRRISSVFLFAIVACAHLNANPKSPVTDIDNYSRQSVFVTRTTTRIPLPDGTTEVDTFSGNAFLIEENVFLSVAHLFLQDGRISNIIEVATANGPVRGNLALLDATRDVAIFTANVPGVPLSIREATSKDAHAYTVGALILDLNDAAIGLRALHETVIVRRPLKQYGPHEQVRTKENPDTMILGGMIIQGMSGSPLIAMDGTVIGVISATNDDHTIGYAVDADYLLSNLRYYKEQIVGKKK